MDRYVTHATFSLERSYPAPLARVFAAWADPDEKARWFAGGPAEHQLDFRVPPPPSHTSSNGSAACADVDSGLAVAVMRNGPAAAGLAAVTRIDQLIANQEEHQ